MLCFSFTFLNDKTLSYKSWVMCHISIKCSVFEPALQGCVCMCFSSVQPKSNVSPFPVSTALQNHLSSGSKRIVTYPAAHRSREWRTKEVASLFLMAVQGCEMVI